jgi:hypothetical protein
MSKKRRETVAGRLRACGEDDFRRLFEKAARSAFLQGKNRSGWRATFDWLIEEDNMAKVLDGNYDDAPGPAGGADGRGFARIIERFMQKEDGDRPAEETQNPKQA